MNEPEFDVWVDTPNCYRVWYYKGQVVTTIHRSHFTDLFIEPAWKEGQYCGNFEELPFDIKRLLRDKQKSITKKSTDFLEFEVWVDSPDSCTMRFFRNGTVRIINSSTSLEEQQKLTRWGYIPVCLTKKSTDFLTLVKETQEERGKQYDSPEGERSMGKTITTFNTITGHTLKESDGWLFMQLLKDVRQWQKETYHEDSAVDCISYAALKAEALSEGK